MFSTHPEIVSPDLLEFTTRVAAGVLQLAEYEKTMTTQVNNTSATLKLLRVLGGGDRVYTGFLHLGDDVEKRLAPEDKVNLLELTTWIAVRALQLAEYNKLMVS